VLLCNVTLQCTLLQRVLFLDYTPALLIIFFLITHTLSLCSTGGRRCTVEGCNKGARDKHFCAGHGGGKRCSVTLCNKSAVGGSGHCCVHGGGKYVHCTSMHTDMSNMYMNIIPRGMAQ
jgi:hypothetical protein